MEKTLWFLLISAYQAYGRDAAKRMLTIPRATIEEICRAVGSDPDEALAARGRAVSGMMGLLDELVIPDPAFALKSLDAAKDGE